MSQKSDLHTFEEKRNKIVLPHFHYCVFKNKKIAKLLMVWQLCR